MALSVDGKIDVQCTLEHAWALFQRFDEIARLIPSVDEVAIDGDRIQGRVSVKLGVIPITSRVTLEVVEKKHLACLKIEGLSYLGETLTEQVKKDGVRGVEKDSVGRLRLHLDLRPTEEAGRIAILYEAQVEAEGRLRRIYESILKTKAPAMMRQFAENVRQNLERVVAPEPAAEPVGEAVAAPVEIEAAPAPRPPWWRRALGWLGRLFRVEANGR